MEKFREHGRIARAFEQNIGDKLCDLLPAMVWPKTRVVFYIFAVLEIAALGLAVVRLWGR
jgi:hypothetical protein